MPSQQGPKTRTITVFLLKEDFTTYASALKDAQSLRNFPLSDSVSFQGALYLREPSRKHPAWAEFVESGVDGPLDDLFNSSTSAVLFLAADDRLFAVTFGYGRHLLLPHCYERDFGLRVTLNSVNPERLSSIDTHTFEELTVHTRTQTSRGTAIDSFSIDILKDVLRAITGEPRDGDLASRLTGSDALVLTARMEFHDLATKCIAVLDAYSRDDYRQVFPWIDHLKEVKDPQVLEDLHELLVEAVQSSGVERLYLAPPELVDWRRGPEFRYQRDDDDTRRTDIDLEAWKATLRDPESQSIGDLKKSRVLVYYEGGDVPSDAWRVYDTIVFETELQSRLYVLTAGRWFAVDEDFVNEVRAFLQTLHLSAVDLPPSDPQEREDHYNERVVGLHPDFGLLDQREIMHGGGASRIELCDILTPDRKFVHVKRKTRSATLSHLFSQAAVAADLFLNDEGFREKAREKVQEANGQLATLIPADRPISSEWEIVYAIVTQPVSNFPLNLPFFSQLNLMHAARLLGNLGFRVTVRLIEEQAGTSNDE